ncbi:MAG TPA: hypothetical protein PLT25_08790, partial [Acidocella sp.]|nr:hypothetical protein [Acidocella sp.]
MAKIIFEDGSLDPQADFEDDGGTPAYRARQSYKPGKKMTVGKLIGAFIGWFLAVLFVPPIMYIFMLWFSYSTGAGPWMSLITF